MNLKKLAALTVAMLFAMSIFTACSANSDESNAPAKTMDEMFTLIDEANPIDNPRELTDMDLEFNLMLPSDTVVSYKGVASNDGDNAGMTLILEVAEGSAEDTLALLQEYSDNQVLFWSNYEEFASAVESVENGVLTQSGNYIIQVFASNNGGDYTAIETAIESALS